MNNKNIIVVQNLIRCLDLASLKNFEVVANLVRAFGIVHWGAPVFGNDEPFKNPTQNMAGIYQTPNQIAKALIYLSDFKFDSYLEVGVFQGGNFLFVSEYLRRFNPNIRCIGIDPTGYMNSEIMQILEKEIWLSFKSIDSDHIKGQEFDLVFIDGDHSAEWIRKDWDNVGKQAKVCMIHDIQEPSCPDIPAFWKQLKLTAGFNPPPKSSPNTLKDKMFKEFLDYSGAEVSQGIGIIVNEVTKKGGEA